MAQKRSYSEMPSVAMKVQDASMSSGNNSARARWFSGIGLGLFIHGSLDSQLGSVISHLMVAAYLLNMFFCKASRTDRISIFDHEV